MPSVNPIGQPFIELSEVDSSNNYAMRQAQAQMAEHGTTWFAWHQKAGKGQRGKRWSAEPGLNIIVSTIIQPSSFAIGEQFVLSVMVALACYDFFSGYALDETKIKWPNDIYWKDRKAGGILIENIINGSNWKFAVVGIGLNINQTIFPAEVLNPVSLKQITGIAYDVIDLSKQLCTCLEKRWQQLNTVSLEALLEEYGNHLYKKGDVVTFKEDNIVFRATVVGVNRNGELLLNTGFEKTVPFGKIEWIV